MSEFMMDSYLVSTRAIEVLTLVFTAFLYDQISSPPSSHPPPILNFLSCCGQQHVLPPPSTAHAAQFAGASAPLQQTCAGLHDGYTVLADLSWHKHSQMWKKFTKKHWPISNDMQDKKTKLILKDHTMFCYLTSLFHHPPSIFIGGPSTLSSSSSIIPALKPQRAAGVCRWGFIAGCNRRIRSSGQPASRPRTMPQLQLPMQ